MHKITESLCTVCLELTIINSMLWMCEMDPFQCAGKESRIVIMQNQGRLRSGNVLNMGLKVKNNTFI